MTGGIFAVLYVSIIMDHGLTRCYKTTGFYIYICSFSTEFMLQTDSFVYISN